MEEELKDAIVIINGVQYNVAGATEPAKALLQDLAIVEKELARLKVSYDIAGIAKQTLLTSVHGMIEAGDSGFEEIPQEVVETKEETEEAAAE